MAVEQFISRRAIFGAGAAATAALAIPAAASGRNHDLDHLERAVDERLTEATRISNAADVSSAEWEAWGKADTAVLSRVEALPGNSTQVLRIKAKGILLCRCNYIDDIEFGEQRTTDTRLAEQVIRSLLRAN